MRTGISLSLNTQSALRSFPQTFGLILSMQENSKDQPPSLSQLLLDNYLAETAVHHKHSRINPDTPSSPHLLYGSFRGSAEDSNVHEELQLPDLSAFLSQEELDKSVDLARQAISHEPSEQEESHKPSFVPYMGTDLNSTHNSTQYAPEKMDILPTLEPFTPERQSVESIKDNGLRISRTSRDQHVDFKRPVRNTPYGLETQSKKEFLNKAADFIEELSSLFKANSSKRIRPRACKAHSRQNQNKAQASSVSTSLNLNDRERPVFHINQQLELTEFQSQDSRLEEEPFNPVTAVQCEPLSEVECESAAIKAQSSEEQLYEPPHFIQKLKSREVPEGSKVQLDCIVRGIPTPEVRWFCEGKELENSPDIQIINNGELHSLVIAEAFEEDTGRYSCFASNICGTDSTSAEIYIEGASSSDSEAEQHFETQKHKRVQHTTAALQSVGSEPGNTGLTTLPTEVVPSLPTAPVLTVTPSAKVSAAQLSVLEESPAPITSMESTPSTTPTIILPTPTTAGQGTFNQEYTPVHPSQPNMVENQNNYPQGLDGKPIIAAPVFTKSLQDLVAYEGQLVVLECRVKGVPSPKVQWYREGTFIEDSPDFRILQKKPRSTAESEEICTLVIAEVFPEDSGKFTCTASNKYGTVSSTASLTVKGNEDNSFAKVMNNQTVESPSSQEPEFNNSCLKHPSSSCLKTRPEGVLVNPNESRVNSRVGLRVTFKLPEDEEVEEENDIPCSKSSEDIYPVSTNKEPPPVLAKPKLDPMQLQILHNQVLLEQQQGNSTQNHQEPSWSDVENIKPIVDSQYPVLPNSLPSKHKSDPSPLINPRHTPQLIASTVSLLSSTQTPLLHAVPVPHLKTTPEAISLSVTQPNMAPNAQINSMTQSAVDQNTLVSQCNMGVTPPAHQLNVGSTTLPLQHSLASINPISHLSMVSPPPVNQPIINPSIPMPQSSIAHSAPVLHLGSETSNQLGVNPNARLSMNSMTPSTELNSSISIAPSTQLNSTSMPQMRMASVSPVSSAPTTQRDMAVIPTHHLNAAVPLETSSAVTKLDTNPAAQISVGLSPVLKTFSSPQLDAGHMSLPSTAPSHLLNKPLVPATSVTPVPFMNTIQASLTEKSPVSNVSTSQTFNYARPKEFVAAQTLSPVRSPVTTLQDLTLEGSSPLGYITQSPRMFPTRVLESPNSPTVHISSPTFVPSARLSSVFALRTQSPPQAPSPSSSSSTPSPIQNPVAFLSSVLPSLPTSPPTNAMGLPMSAPAVPPSILRKNAKGLRPISDEDSHDVSESLLQNIEKKLRFKDESTPYGQQKLTYEGKESRPLGPNIPTATVINYDEEYKVSNFEQRLMSEIEFRLERTPVEESDDEIQHDDIPRGKCIAPLFDKKLKNYRAVEGIPVTFTCKVVGIPIPKVYWFKDGKQILKKNEQYKKIREGDGTCSLHIEAVTNNDDGNYTVMAANPQGRASCSGHLIVQVGPVRNRPVIHTQRVRTRVQEVEGEPTQERFFKPHFLQAPGDLVSQEGRLCRLDCKVNGLPHPELMWLLNGKPIYPDVCHRMLVRENGIHSLVIDPLTQNDAGMYTCIATNKAGQNSFSLELKVVERENKQPPQFVEKLQNTGIAEGLPIRLECRIVGMPPPVIYWKKDNDTITQSKDRFSIHQDATGYVCLLIQPTRKEDAGWYTVSAKNEAGIISCTARLDIYAQWHQQIHQPIKKLSQSGGSYATFGGHGLDIKSAFPSTDIMFSSSAQEATPESEEL